jgi:hypothetical protein
VDHTQLRPTVIEAWLPPLWLPALLALVFPAFAALSTSCIITGLLRLFSLLLAVVLLVLVHAGLKRFHSDLQLLLLTVSLSGLALSTPLDFHKDLGHSVLGTSKPVTVAMLWLTVQIVATVLGTVLTLRLVSRGLSPFIVSLLATMIVSLISAQLEGDGVWTFGTGCVAHSESWRTSEIWTAYWWLQNFGLSLVVAWLYTSMGSARAIDQGPIAEVQQQDRSTDRTKLDDEQTPTTGDAKTDLVARSDIGRET